MYKSLIFLNILFFMIGCGVNKNNIDNIVSSPEELRTAIQNVKAGDEIILKNGVWKDLMIHFYGIGTEEKPIILRAETPGKVSLIGKSYLKIGGEFLIVDGLYFNNGYTPVNTVIDFKINEDSIANNCRVTNCVIEEFTQPNRYDPDHWVEFWGRYNQLDHCYIAGKYNQGPTIRVFLSGNEHIRNYHKIINNHFGPRPRKGGPKAETIQIGDSYTSMAPSYVKVANNYFENCNGEVEIISNKSNFNEFKNNIFFECEGSLVMRHGNYCLIDGNFFIGNEASRFMGGIRVINTGHWITNNYFYNLKGDEFRSPLAIMNGIPKSPLNRYNQVTDVVVAYNSWIDCKSPWQFSVGANMNKKDVLPESEIRSARPIRVLIANNLIYNQQADSLPIKSYDQIDGVLFEKNIIDNQNINITQKGIINKKLSMNKIADWIFVPSDANTQIENVYNGFGFQDIKEDIFGNSRLQHSKIGAISGNSLKSNKELNKKNYGAEWFASEKPLSPSKIYNLSESTNDISKIIAEANSGDILELSDGDYQIEKSLIIDKKINIRASDQNLNVRLIFSGKNNTALFEIHPKGSLALNNISLIGMDQQYAFATLEKNMSHSFKLFFDNGQIQNFENILKVFKGSFADSISISNSKISNCKIGLQLAAENDDLGDYNAEFVSVKNCIFDNVQMDVINFYRGGYDESTIGGNLIVQNSLFKNCGKLESSKILLKTRGIINVYISNNSFENNHVQLIALLWGEKNNREYGNKIIGSGKFQVDKYLKQKLVY